VDSICSHAADATAGIVTLLGHELTRITQSDPIRTLPIRLRLLRAFGVVLLIMVAAALTGRWGMSTLHREVTVSI
jgi:hypothetical protein